MYLRHRFKSWLIVFYMRRVYATGGVDSLLRDGTHSLLFDFDGITLREVETQLRHVQDKYNLPTIYLLSSGRPDSWHAYCLKRMSLNKALRIVLECPNIDLNFVRFAMWRGWFTLRVVPKNGRAVEAHSRLYSQAPPDVTVQDFDKFTFYETGSG